MKPQIIPAILATSEEVYKQQVDKVNSIAADTDGWVHIDFADNIFVPNKTIGLDVMGKYPVNLKKEAHLMIQKPGVLCEELLNAGFERIIFHLESEDLHASIDSIYGKVEIGIAVNMETSLDHLMPFLEKIDCILLMSIVPGFQGREFNTSVIEKIKQAQKLGKKIIVDGGITPENARMIIDAGADGLVVGSHLLNGDVKQNLAKFKEIL